MSFKLIWKTTDGRYVEYGNMGGEQVQNTILMDIKSEPSLNPATIRIQGQERPARVYIGEVDERNRLL